MIGKHRSGLPRTGDVWVIFVEGSMFTFSSVFRQDDRMILLLSCLSVLA